MPWWAHCFCRSTTFTIVITRIYRSMFIKVQTSFAFSPRSSLIWNQCGTLNTSFVFPELGASHNQTLEGVQTLFHAVDLNSETQPDGSTGRNRGIPCLPKKKFSTSLSVRKGAPLKKQVANLEDESARRVEDQNQVAKVVYGSISYSLRLARSCCAGQEVLVEGDFALHSNTANGAIMAEVFVELDCQVMAQTDTDNGKDNGNNQHLGSSLPTPKECLLRER